MVNRPKVGYIYFYDFEEVYTCKVNKITARFIEFENDYKFHKLGYWDYISKLEELGYFFYTDIFFI